MFIQVHQDGSVALPFAPGPVVYPKVSHGIASRRVSRSLNHPKHRIVADRDSQPVQNTTAGQSACGVANEAYDPANSCGPATMGSRNFRYWFGEDLPFTSLVTTPKTPIFQSQLYSTPFPR